VEARTWGAGVYLYVYLCLGKLGERRVNNERLIGQVANIMGLNDAQTTQHTGGRESGIIHTRSVRARRRTYLLLPRIYRIIKGGATGTI